MSTDQLHSSPMAEVVRVFAGVRFTCLRSQTWRGVLPDETVLIVEKGQRGWTWRVDGEAASGPIYPTLTRAAEAGVHQVSLVRDVARKEPKKVVLEDLGHHWCLIGEDLNFVERVSWCSNCGTVRLRSRREQGVYMYWTPGMDINQPVPEKDSLCPNASPGTIRPGKDGGIEMKGCVKVTDIKKTALHKGPVR